MAKKKELSPEERLEAALVPEEEWPYEVPENWCWTYMGSLYEINPKTVSDDNIEAAFIPMEKISAGMNRDFEYDVQPWGKARKGHTQFADGDVAFAKISPCFENGKSMILNGLPNGIGGGTTELIILRQPLVNQVYTYWLISTEDFIRRGCMTYSGTVGQQRISMEFVRNYPVPLPPLPEQHRIVTRIESLFSKLDEAKEAAQAVVDGFEDRKAAILHKAFTGELTKEWREKNGISIQGWKQYKYGDLGDSKLGKMLDKEKNVGRAVQYLRNINVRWFEFDLSDVLTMLATEEEINKLHVQDGDLFICEGGEPGRCAIWHGSECDMIFQKALHRFRPNEKVISDYICYYLYYLSKNDTLEKYFTGTTIKHLTGKSLAEIPIILPTIKEQTIIIKFIEKVFDIENCAKDSAESVLDQIDTMKKSILARAFRGELGTNDSQDENAVELLKRVLSSG